MLECPRCGFSQPDDRFCANCGLDVSNYHPNPTPFHKKLLRNPIFHLTLAIVVAFFIASYIFKKQSEFVESIPTNETQEVVNTPPQAKPKAPPPKIKQRPPVKQEVKSLTEIEKAAIKKVPPKPPTPRKAEIPEEQAKAVQPAQEIKKNPPAFPVPKNLEVLYYELDRESLTAILNESRTVRETSFSQVVVHSNKESLFSQLSSRGRVVSGSRTQQLEDSLPIEIRYDLAGELPESSGQFSLNITPSGIKPGEANVDFAISLEIPGGENESSFTTNLSANVPLKFNEVIVIAGLVPHRELSEGDPHVDGTPLSIMESQDFSTDSSEFVMIIHHKP